jgi:PQQ enzyme repeat
MKTTNRMMWRVRRVLLFCVLACASVTIAGPAGAAPTSRSVTTYHYDSMRTGWNKQETTLKAASFPANFGALATVALDDQVDAQPLLMANETIAGAVHDVVYVVTENNSVYALDAASGAVLVQRNLGQPVHTPLGCVNNGPNVGITSTPVIDPKRGRIYVMAYVSVNGTPQYQLHALDLLTLNDAVPPVTVAATHTLSDGSVFTFNATYQRQRPALLMLNGSIYAGFGSFCDFSASQSRGWVLGWTPKRLAPLAGNQLNDTQATSPTRFFLSSVWMSGFGLASNGSTIFFSTGNSDCVWYAQPETCPPQSTYDGVTNIQESVVGLQPNLTTLTGVFTPANVFQMDQQDEDLGASGAMLLPTQTGGAQLATIVSKDGRLFLLNQASLPRPAPDRHQLPVGCWCGTSYYQGSDGIGRVITSAGSLQTWQVVLTPAPLLVAEATSSSIPASEQDPGFFTVVSSNGVAAGSAIIWAVGRPSTTPPVVTLYAFSATPVSGTLPLLYSAVAGQWPHLGGNANIVPLEANGRVYVAAYKTLTIFGPGGTARAALSAAPVDESPAGAVSRVTGTLQSLDGSTFTLLTRSGRTLRVDASAAIANERAATLIVGQPYTVLGPLLDQAGNAPWRATSIMHAKPGQGAWPIDR